MDVNRISCENRLNEYLNWLEVALRSQVVCNMGFLCRYESIKVFVRSEAFGQLHHYSHDDTFRSKFDRLAERLSAVAEKYHIPKTYHLRRFFRRPSGT